MSRIPAMRADGQRNRDAILEAAFAIFAEHGMNAPLEMVAARADVSRTTLYRNFADREALAMAVFERNLAELESYAATLVGQDDGLFQLLAVIAAGASKSAGLSEALRTDAATHPKLSSMKQRVLALLLPHLTNAQNTGSVHQEFGVADIDMVIDVLAGAMTAQSEENLEQRAQRLVNLLRYGMQTGPR